MPGIFENRSVDAVNKMTGRVPTEIIGNNYAVDNDLAFKDEIRHTFESYQTEHLDLPNSMGDIIGNSTARTAFIGELMESITDSPLFTNPGASQEPFYKDYGTRMEGLIENSLRTIAQESAMIGYSPIVSYNPFFLKKQWVACVFKDILMTEVPKSPLINLAFEKRYLRDMQGTEYPLPDVHFNKEIMAKLNDDSTGLNISEKAIEISKFKPRLDCMTSEYFPGMIAGDKSQELTFDMHVWKVEMVDPADTTDPKKTYEVPVNIKTDVTTHNFVKGEVHYDILDEHGAVTKTLRDQLVGNINFEQGTISLFATDECITKVYLRGKLANRFNNRSLEVVRKVEQLQYVMPESGPHLNTAVTVEDAADALATQNIDQIADNSDIMGRELAELEDFGIRQFLDTSFQVQDEADCGPHGYDKMIVKGVFNTLPYDGYSRNISDWNTDSREYFERIINGLRTILRTPDMVIVAVCNPVNIRWFQNGINWVFTDDTQISGIKISYNYGIYTTGQDRVHFVTSMQFDPNNGVRFIPIPLTPELISFKHYKYNTIIDRNYRNPVHSLVPNIMCTQRTLTFEVLPIQGELKITGRELASPDTLKRTV